VTAVLDPVAVAQRHPAGLRERVHERMSRLSGIVAEIGVSGFLL